MGLHHLLDHSQGSPQHHPSSQVHLRGSPENI
ncbi:hypothetical protein LINPERPRIM_LOCUS29223 [Linum perenne]